jgi:DNA-binding Lrp family transcriptional regulator
MPKAFIMIDVVPGREQAVQDGIAKLAGVKMVYPVTGEPDLIAFVDAEPYEEFAVILASIRQLEGVRDTESNLVIESP